LTYYVNGNKYGNSIALGGFSSTIAMTSVLNYPHVQMSDHVSNQWLGELDDVTIYNTALSAGDVLELYAPNSHTSVNWIPGVV
jgi:uncharacterized phosphosugar-binding protein